MLEDMLQAFIDHCQVEWDQLLPLAEFACNNAVNASTGLTPFFVVYGRHPCTPAHGISELQDTVPAAAEFLETIQNATKVAKDSLTCTKANQEKYANQKRQPLTFQEGDLVLLSSAHIHPSLRSVKTSKKLTPRFIGPFTIVQRISETSYKLNLPESFKMHPVFHVSLLKPYTEPSTYPGRPPILPSPPSIIVENEEEYEVERILNHRNRRNRKEYLVKWKGYPEYDASWEPESHLSHAPKSVKEYELLRGRSPEEGGMV